MTANEYQVAAARTLIDKPDFKLSANEFMLLWATVGLAGEAGEIVEHVKKGVLHQHGIDLEALEEELGDLLWYVAAICTKAGLNLDDVMKINIKKLEIRYPNGFNSEDSIKRSDKRENKNV